MSLFCRTDVTAVKLCYNYILAGIGSYIHVFDKESTTLKLKLKCLNGQKVYGIIPSKDRSKLLVFGGKQFAIFSVENGEFSMLTETVVCDDWMHSGVWTDRGTMALLSAHNVVQKWQTSPPTLLSIHASRDNSILYSGLLVSTADGDIVVFAGTVYSEIIVHCGAWTLHRLTGHRGVIFSISCDPIKETIVTTSDDRSVRIWKVKNDQDRPKNTKVYWKNAEITCHHEVYGHAARVMRSCITNDCIVSVGEDSAICFWDYEGKLIRKVETHQNGSVWAIDCDDKDLVTGGGDCGVIKHPLILAKEYGHNDVLDINAGIAGTPKKIQFTARRNIISLNENNELIYFDLEEKSKMVYKLNHESTYKLLSISSCKQIVAVADMNGKLDVFTENCKDKAFLHNIFDNKLLIGKIMSMHWAGNRHLVFCSDNGVLTVLAQSGNNIDTYATFVLPRCKERWITAAAIDPNRKILIAGDRCGNLHLYKQGITNPTKSFSKVHGRYGPTTVTIKENCFITTGRDGTVKLYSFNEDLTESMFMNSKELEFNWVEKFLDKNERLVCGFQERLFVVYNLETNTQVLQVQCGGGHRSWDAVRYFEKINSEYEECIKLVFVKNSDIQSFVFQLSKIVSKNIINGSHSKEINCLQIYKTGLEESTTFYISGGEDTTLRISSVNRDSNFQDRIVFKHLSSVRTMKTIKLDNDKILLMSAGGRAQICVKLITFTKINDVIKPSRQELVNHMVKGTDKERKGNQTWRNCTIDFEPETRIMDVDYMKIDNETYVIYTGCSDACIRVFLLRLGPKVTFKLIKQIEQHKTCILKTKYVRFSDRNILISCTTRGEITFSEVNYSKDQETLHIETILCIVTNKSGINGFDARLLSNNSLIIGSAGDDNAIHLNVIERTDQCNLASLKVTHSWQTDKLHSSQITGLILLDDIMISTSIDQRVTLCSWVVGKKEICCQFLSQILSDIADIHGMELVEYSRNSVTICVYGKGIEVINMPIKRP